MQNTLDVGVIGIGAMGMNVAKRLLDRGFPTFVRDIRPEAESEAREAGATVCASPDEVGRRCDAVITLVVDAAQTEDVLFGPRGLAAGLRPGAVHIMSSTIQPAAAASLAERLAKRGLLMIDAPCSGGPAKARAGEMTLMAAAPQQVLRRVALGEDRRRRVAVDRAVIRGQQHQHLAPLGFPLSRSSQHPFGFDPQASLPTERHLARLLRQTSNATLQYLLTSSVQLLFQEFVNQAIPIDDLCISLDTKHILAWVKENNPKAYVEVRFNKAQQPKGDPDCKLGCKRKHNKRPAQTDSAVTPTTNPLPADTVQIGEFYWGYGSGIVVAKVQDKGEFVLAEMTQPFDHSDLSYFFPLMAKTEQILGYQPRFGTFDAAFDAWYVHEYFHRDEDPQAFAAVPFSEKGRYKTKGRKFDPQGLPICAAGLSMPLLFTFTDRTSCLIEHERGKYGCPMFFPQPSGQACPVQHKHANEKKKGCTAMMPTSIGARLRYTLDREKIRRGASYVKVANHQSLLDILVLFRLFAHFKWVSKIENFRIRCIGWNMRLNGYVPLRRGDKQSIGEMMAASAHVLDEGNSIMMCPEGTRSPDGRLRAFKHGALTLAQGSGCPILPIPVEGTADALPKRGFVLGGRHAIRIRVLDEIPHEKIRDREVEDVTREVWEIFATELGPARVAAA